MSDAKDIKSRQEFFMVANKDVDGGFYLLSGDPHVIQDDAREAALQSIAEINDWRHSSTPPLKIPLQTRRVLKCTVVDEINEAESALL